MMKIDNDEQTMLLQELAELRKDHGELDTTIHQLTHHTQHNQFEIKRLKKQKLKLKDAITRLESNLIPDLHA